MRLCSQALGLEAKRCLTNQFRPRLIDANGGEASGASHPRASETALSEDPRSPLLGVRPDVASFPWCVETTDIRSGCRRGGLTSTLLMTVCFVVLTLCPFVCRSFSDFCGFH